MISLLSRATTQFLAVCQARNLTEAAEQCGVTQPAITKSIRKLEALAGMPLFEHSTRGLSLTQAGRLLERHARSMQAQVRYLEADIAALTGGQRGTIRMGVGHAVALTLLPPLIAHIQEVYPHMEIEFETGVADELYPHLADGSIDLMIASIAGIGEPSDFLIEQMFLGEMAVFARRDNPIWQSNLAPSDLVGSRWYLFTHDVEGLGALERYLRRSGDTAPMSALRCSALDTMMELAARTDGLAFLASTLTAEAERRDLYPLPLPSSIWTFPVGLVVRRSASYVAPVRSIMEFCREFDPFACHDGSSQ